VRSPIPPNIGAADKRGKSYRGERSEGTQNYNGEGVLVQPHHTRCLLRSEAVRHSSNSKPRHANLPWLILTALRILGGNKGAGQSFRTPSVSSQPLDNMIKVVTAVNQIMTEFNGAISEEDKIVAITKIV
jgi:hypothetical protein